MLNKFSERKSKSFYFKKTFHYWYGHFDKSTILQKIKNEKEQKIGEGLTYCA